MVALLLALMAGLVASTALLVRACAALVPPPKDRP
jgi:hypothetical protein